LRRRYPDFEFFNNCELTFRFGHALLFAPKMITGTIEEAYRYLFRASETLLIINHPYIASDRWKGSIIPHVGGVEVINGAVYSHGEAAAFRERMLGVYEHSRIIEYPHVACYAEYLAQGVPVLAFGNSDAHSLAEIGTGVTGYWDSSLEAAIEKSAIFAATDTDIRLYWEYDQRRSQIRWKAEIDPSTRISDGIEFPAKIECYRGDTLIASHSELSGSIDAEKEGYYWFGLQKGSRFALSSPVRSGSPKRTKGIYRFPLDLHRELYFGRDNFTDTPPTSIEADQRDRSVELYLYASEAAQVIDSAGRPIDGEQRFFGKDVVIDKSGDPRQVDEFFIWLERNELHEYKFVRLDYSIDESDVLRLRAMLLPALILPEGCSDEDIRQAGEDIQAHMDRIKSVELYVEIPPLRQVLFTLPNEKDLIEYPLHVYDGKLGMQSHIYFSPEGHRAYQYITKIDRTTR
jgi:hypothetical protein